jgi:hypothetical protein
MYNDLLKMLYAAANQELQEIQIPPVRVICVTGNEPPATKQFQHAIAVLFDIGYGMKTGLKFGNP